MVMRTFLASLIVYLAPTIYSVHASDNVRAFHEDLWTVLPRTAEITELAHGFTWSEGPTWDRERQQLYFSDVPKNIAYAWSPELGLNVFMSPSGLQSDSTAGFREPGSNGLLMSPDGRLLIANHGTRSVERMDIKTRQRQTIASHYEGKRLNSPNDVAITADGTLYFTDPPYGLEGLNASPLKELGHNGVYQVEKDGTIALIDGSLSYPNGIALSPDEQTLYVAVSDPVSPKIYKYSRDGTVFTDRSVFFNAEPYLKHSWPGLPDGMAVAETGHLFATGPGGVFVLSKEGIALGLIKLESATANCTFGQDGSTLFITSGSRVLAMGTLVVGAGWRND